MKIALLLYVLFIGIFVTAQPVVMGKPGFIQVEYGDGYETKEEKVDDTILKLTISNRVRKTIAAEYFRWNDSAFFYRGYDSSGEEALSGVLSLNPLKKRFYPVLKPDLDKDPDLSLGIFKDTLIPASIYDRHGNWQMTTSDNTVWHGSFSHDAKTGIWYRVRGKEILFQHSTPIFPFTDSIVLYEHDGPITHNYNFFSTDSIFSLLKGKWVVDWKQSSQYFVICHREGNEVFEYNFISPDKCFFVNYKSVFNSMTIESNWRIQDGILIFFAEGAPIKYKILLLTHDQLILQRLKD